jgi:hypothetical protein
MALIDYRGFRLVAMSILPLSTTTTTKTTTTTTTQSLVYGSRDGGKTIYNSSVVFAAKMEKAALQLNLKGHLCGLQHQQEQQLEQQPKQQQQQQEKQQQQQQQQQVFLHGPTDIEGHIGTDGRHYVLDLARVFPPTCEDASVKETFLFKLMRPEWVAQYKSVCALSSDAFSGFSSFRMSSVENQEVYAATQQLLNNRVPAFANWIDQQCAMSGDDVDSFAKIGHKSLTETIHRQGRKH